MIQIVQQDEYSYRSDLFFTDNLIIISFDTTFAENYQIISFHRDFFDYSEEWRDRALRNSGNHQSGY